MHWRVRCRTNHPIYRKILSLSFFVPRRLFFHFSVVCSIVNAKQELYLLHVGLFSSVWLLDAKKLIQNRSPKTQSHSQTQLFYAILLGAFGKITTEALAGARAVLCP